MAAGAPTQRKTAFLMRSETWAMLLLTVGIPGNDRLRLQRDSGPELIDSSDSEDVLVVLDQSGADT